MQITLKSPTSVSPYRVENACKDVVVQLIQAPLIARVKKHLFFDDLKPGEGTPYAWDEPMMPNKLQVWVRRRRRQGLVEALHRVFTLTQPNPAVPPRPRWWARPAHRRWASTRWTTWGTRP